MINILYLHKTLKTNKLSEFVGAIDAAPLDINIAIWDAIEHGEIEINEKKDRIRVVEGHEAAPFLDRDLADKILRVVKQFNKEQTNPTRGRMMGYMKEPSTGQGYPVHEALMTLQAMIDNGEIVEFVTSVPEVKKKRPFHRFVFLCLPENENEEWNAKAVNKWIANWEKKK